MNNVELINNKICKTISDKNSLNKEIVGTLLFGFIDAESVPQLVEWGGGYCVTGNIKSAKTCYELLGSGIDTKEVNSFVAEFIAKIFEKYNLGINIPTFMKWEYFVENTLSEFSFNMNVLTPYIGDQRYKNILNNLVKIKATKMKNMTIIHGDLHLDNILISGEGVTKKIFVIDFEHCVEAPLEMEFQNSLFWNDSKSLNVEDVVQKLKSKFGIMYSKKVEAMLANMYIANQLNKAVKNGDIEKLQKLATN